MCSISVEPIPSTISKPKRARQSLDASAETAPRPPTRRSARTRSAPSAAGSRTIAPNSAGTEKKTVGRCCGGSRDPLWPGRPRRISTEVAPNQSGNDSPLPEPISVEQLRRRERRRHPRGARAPGLRSSRTSHRCRGEGGRRPSACRSTPSCRARRPCHPGCGRERIELVRPARDGLVELGDARVLSAPSRRAQRSGCLQAPTSAGPRHRRRRSRRPRRRSQSTKWRKFSSVSSGLTGTGTAPIRIAAEEHDREHRRVVQHEQHPLLSPHTELAKQPSRSVDLAAKLVVAQRRVLGNDRRRRRARPPRTCRSTRSLALALSLARSAAAIAAPSSTASPACVTGRNTNLLRSSFICHMSSPPPESGR